VAPEGNDKGREPEDSETSQRLNRELLELLNELRVALPGVQVLFAFLLTVPFSSGFEKLSSLDRDVYFTAFMCTAIASVLLIAPTAQHRLRFRKGDKEAILRIANRLAITGLVFLGLAIGQVVFLIGNIMFGVGIAALMAGIIVTLGLVLWFVVPLLRKFNE
jgi:hypothetical protein